MLTYNIKENGHTIGSARGKHNAVKYLEKYLDSYKLKDAVWDNVLGEIYVYAGANEFKIVEVRL